MSRENILRKMAEFQPDKPRAELLMELHKHNALHYVGSVDDFMNIVAENQAMEDKGMYFDGNHWRWRKSWIRRLLHLPEPKRLKYV